MKYNLSCLLKWNSNEASVELVLLSTWRLAASLWHSASPRRDIGSLLIFPKRHVICGRCTFERYSCSSYSSDSMTFLIELKTNTKKTGSSIKKIWIVAVVTRGAKFCYSACVFLWRGRCTSRFFLGFFVDKRKGVVKPVTSQYSSWWYEWNKGTTRRFNPFSV